MLLLRVFINKLYRVHNSVKEVIAFLYAEAKALKATVNSTIDIRLTYLLTYSPIVN